MTAESTVTDPEVPATGPAAVEGFLRILDVEKIEENIYRGISPKVSLQRVFGGQVAGQALVAAYRTVEPDRHVHSLHSYFIRPGDPTVPIIYEVDRVRDGKSFSVRRTVAIQHGKPIYVLSASYQLDQDGLDHQTEMPDDIPDPESLPTLLERFADVPDYYRHYSSRAQTFDIRYVDDPPRIQREKGPRIGQHRIWLKVNGTLPDDALIHRCALTFASDMHLLDSVLIRHGVAPGEDADPLSMASLDHAMWFHRPFRMDEWILYVMSTPSASGGRGLGIGRFHTQDGTHVASVVQEGMVRLQEGLNGFQLTRVPAQGGQDVPPR